MSTAKESKPTAWWFVLLASAIAGLVFGVLTVSGWIHGFEGRVALLTIAVLGFFVARRGLHRPVYHGFVSGFLSGLIAVELQAAFLPMYFANNPEYALVEIPFGLPARLATAVFAPINAAIAGVLTAGVVWILCKFWGNPPKGAAA